jgi:GT2 family glycosyltransferase
MGVEQHADGRPIVSVVIVNWNTRVFLEQALRSLLVQTDQPRYEIVVVDNGSTDGSAEVVRTQWPDVKLICHAANVGFAAGNNAGFAHASGEYVLLLNSDTLVLRSTLPGLVSVLRRDPGVGCVGARHLNADGSLQRSTNEFPTLLNDALELTEISRLKIVQRVLLRRFPWWSDHIRACETGWVNGACMMVRRQVIEEIGGLDETFFAYAEEVDWCYRMCHAGWRVVFTPAAEVVHFSGQSLNSDPGLRLRLRYRGHAKFYRKHYSRTAHCLFCSIVTAAAAGRIVALVLLKVASLLGYEPTSAVWEFITQDPIRTRYRAMMFAWLQILCHLPVEPRLAAMGRHKIPFKRLLARMENNNR